MTNPGNLYFYQLCEESYDEYTSTKAPTSTGLNEDSDKRVAICTKIVDAVLATGGVFHKPDGSTLSKKEAIAKTRDRIRQIGLPKIRPVGIGEHDVVSVRGAAVHLYPGIKNWHILIDGYVLSYFAELVDKNGVYVEALDTKEQRDSNKEEKKEIVQEIISIVQKRGGKFRDASLNELSNKEAIEKTKNRLKDLKKLLKNGKRKFIPHTAAAIESMKKGEISGSAAGLSMERQGGFSSVKSTVSSSSQLPKGKKRKASSKPDVSNDKEESKRSKLTSIENNDEVTACI